MGPIDPIGPMGRPPSLADFAFFLLIRAFPAWRHAL